MKLKHCEGEESTALYQENVEYQKQEIEVEKLLSNKVGIVAKGKSKDFLNFIQQKSNKK